MDKFFHRFSELFSQLGLPAGLEEIKAFIEQHSPLASDIRLEDASFWTKAQAEFLRDEILEDADWAEIVDQLSNALRRARPADRQSE